jgi:NAD(P)-dependent dehydrogenase (short-subunit alcohol dehydrogenase family)
MKAAYHRLKIQDVDQNPMTLQDKSVLVTGGGSGIGLGIALALAREGCRVVICGRDARKLTQAAAAHRESPPILAQTCDVTDRVDVEKLVAWFHSEIGPLDIVANAAGINVARRKMAELDPDDFDRILAVNTTGLFNVLHAVLPEMRARRQGLIFNISSVAGKRIMPVAGPAYAASKFAATALGAAVGLEERAHGIRITNIYPGEVDTPLLDQRPVPVPAEKRAVMVHPEDIAACLIAIAKLPEHVIVPELVITPTYQEYL